jgi:hypothetical protein
VKFVATKKRITTNFVSPLFFVAVFGSGIRDPGSGMGKNQDPGFGIRDKHPGSATLLFGPWIRIRDRFFPDPGSSITDLTHIVLRAE